MGNSVCGRSLTTCGRRTLPQDFARSNMQGPHGMLERGSSTHSIGSTGSADSTHKEQCVGLPGAVPAWAVPKEVQQQFDDCTPRNMLLHGLAQFITPSIVWLQIAAVLSLLSQIGVMLVTKQSTHCVGSQAVYNAFFSWSALLPGALIRALAELNAIKHAAVPFAHLGGKFQVLCCPLYFGVWLAGYGVISILNFADMGSDSMFAASTMHSTSCSQGILSNEWDRYWKQSVVGSFCPTPGLSELALCSWILSLLQIVWAIMSTCGKPEAHNDSVAFALADGAGIATLQKMSTDYALCVSKHGLANDSDVEEFSILPYVVPASQQMAARVVGCWLAENSLQLNLQTSVLGLVWHTAQSSGQQVDLQQPMTSICFGIATTLFKILEAVDYCRLMNAANEEIRRLEKKCRDREDSEDAKYVLHKLSALRRASRVVYVGLFILLVSLAWAVAKMWALFACDNHLLNFNGCANL